MRLRIALNGNDIEQYHLVALDGTLNALMKPAAYKKAVVNENAAVDGTMVLSNPAMRKVEKRTISIPFFLRAVSLVDLQKEIENLSEMLVNGKDGTGINELLVVELNRCYRLYYDSISFYSNFDLEGKAFVTIKFTEYNPKNTSV